MLKDNLVMLRKLHGYSQEEVAEKIDISRQAYAKRPVRTYRRPAPHRLKR